MKNADLKGYAMSKGVKLYEVAEKFGVTQCTFSVWLRTEFTPEQKKKFKGFVDEIVKAR